MDGRVENGSRKVDADVRGGVRELLTGTPEDHGFTRPTWTLEILRAVVETVLGVVLSLGGLWTLLHRLGCAGDDPDRSWPVRGEPRAGSGESRP